jgi:hypothetical protein
MKPYVAQLDSFLLTPALDEDEWSVSHSSRSTTTKTGNVILLE